jgi:hypothetical protein
MAGAFWRGRSDDDWLVNLFLKTSGASNLSIGCKWIGKLIIDSHNCPNGSRKCNNELFRLRYTSQQIISNNDDLFVMSFFRFFVRIWLNVLRAPQAIILEKAEDKVMIKFSSITSILPNAGEEFSSCMSAMSVGSRMSVPDGSSY